MALDDIPNLNSGGCAIAAINLHRYILSLGYYPQLVYLCDNRDVVEYNYGGEISCYHALVKVGREYFDSTGWYTYMSLPKKWQGLNVIELTPDYIEQHLRTGSWNRRFNRDKHLPTIEKIFA